MASWVSTLWFFITFLPMVYLVYTLLKIFDYSKILLKGRVGELKALLLIISIGIAFLFASAFVEVIERIANLFV
ncbi:MAG: DUF1146 domain-containing protein [Bacilli bacterium]|nr:DUF1146 domain-containing protein [Bacilli bacterium]